MQRRLHIDFLLRKHCLIMSRLLFEKNVMYALNFVSSPLPSTIGSPLNGYILAIAQNCTTSIKESVEIMKALDLSGVRDVP